MFDAGKTRMIGLPYGEKKLWRYYVKPFSYNTSLLRRTDRWTDRQNCYINIAHQCEMSTTLYNIFVTLQFLRPMIFQFVFIARQHTDARYWYSNSVCLSVRPSVYPWHAGIVWKRLVIVFLHLMVAQSFCFYQHQTSSRNSDGVTPAGALNTGGV